MQYKTFSDSTSIQSHWRKFTLNKYLNPKEYNILHMLLHAEEPLSVSQITRLQPDLTANIVQPAIRKLLKLDLIEIADISINHNILARRFQPTASAPDIIRKMFVDDYLQFSRLISSQSLFSALLRADDSPDTARREVAELEQLLDEYKKKPDKNQ